MYQKRLCVKCNDYAASRVNFSFGFPHFAGHRGRRAVYFNGQSVCSRGVRPDFRTGGSPLFHLFVRRFRKRAMNFRIMPDFVREKVVSCMIDLMM